MISWYKDKIFASDCNTLESINGKYETNKIVYYIINSKQDYFFSLAKGQTNKHVYSSDFQEYKIPYIQDETKQKEYVEQLDKLHNEIEELNQEIEELKDNSKILDKYLKN